jgi:hypothetical protein
MQGAYQKDRLPIWDLLITVQVMLNLMNADLNITSTGTLEVKTLDKNYVIVYGGALDIARDNTARGFLFIQQFIQKCEHTNVLILNAPVRFDLSA